MSNLKISYLITYHNQGEIVSRIIERIHKYVPLSDQILPVWDSINGNQEAFNIVNKWHIKCLEEGRDDFLHERKLPFNNDYGAHKNQAMSLSNLMIDDKYIKSDFFFQLDGDEIPSIFLLENLHTILESNPAVELIYVPRINDFKGVTKEHAKQWGWRLDESPTYKRPRVNFPDFQGRIYRNIPDRIKWDRKLHERIEGHNEYSFLPAEEEYALYHDKTIEKQIETNIRYNKTFTEDENRGHKIT